MLALFAVAILLGAAILLQRRLSAMVLGYMLVGSIISVAHMVIYPISA